MQCVDDVVSGRKDDECGHSRKHNGKRVWAAIGNKKPRHHQPHNGRQKHEQD